MNLVLLQQRDDLGVPGGLGQRCSGVCRHQPSAFAC
jgi:hypothetical protein